MWLHNLRDILRHRWLGSIALPKFVFESGLTKSKASRIANRCGFTIVEMIGTCVLMSVLFAITVPMFIAVARERHSTEQRQFALQHVANLLEQTTTRPWSDLAPGELTVPEAETDLKTLLPGLTRTLVIKQHEGSPTSRQIIASVRWQDHAGQLVSPIQVSAWVYPNGEVR